jgi:hypothetical protein
MTINSNYNSNTMQQLNSSQSQPQTPDILQPSHNRSYLMEMYNPRYYLHSQTGQTATFSPIPISQTAFSQPHLLRSHSSSPHALSLVPPTPQQTVDQQTTSLIAHSRFQQTPADPQFDLIPTSNDQSLPHTIFNQNLSSSQATSSSSQLQKPFPKVRWKDQSKLLNEIQKLELQRAQWKDNKDLSNNDFKKLEEKYNIPANIIKQKYKRDKAGKRNREGAITQISASNISSSKEIQIRNETTPVPHPYFQQLDNVQSNDESIVSSSQLLTLEEAEVLDAATKEIARLQQGGRMLSLDDWFDLGLKYGLHPKVLKNLAIPPLLMADI